LLLFVYINAGAAFKLNGEVIGENSDSLKEPSNQSFVKFCDAGFLTADEILQFLDLVYSFCPVVAVDFGFFFLLPEAQDLVSEGFVDLLAVGFFEE